MATIEIPSAALDKARALNAQRKLHKGGEHPMTAKNLLPGVPDLRDYNIAIGNMLDAMTGEAKRMSASLLNPKLVPARFRPKEEGFSPAIMIDSVMTGLVANPAYIDTTSGVPAIAKGFVGKQVDRVLTVINAENSGDGISEVHREQIRAVTHDAASAMGVTVINVADELEMHMAIKDGTRGKMTDNQKQRLAVDTYANLVSKRPKGFDTMTVEEQITHLAYAEIEGFLIGLWTKNAIGQDYFYVHLANQVEAEINKQRGGRVELWDAYRLGIASALCVNNFRNLPTTRFYNKGSQVPERKFANMISEVSKLAFRKLVAKRVFTDTTPKSPAGKMVRAFKDYISKGKPVNDPAIVDAFNDARTHIATVVLKTVDDMLQYAKAAPAFSLQTLVHQYAVSQSPVPTFTPDKIRERTALLVGTMVSQIENFSATKQAPQLIFSQQTVD